MYKRKFVPTFCCFSFCFRRLDVSLDLGMFLSLDPVLAPISDLCSVLWPGFNRRLCIGLCLPGAPGFPCQWNDFALRILYNVPGSRYSLPSTFKCILKLYGMLQLSLLIRWNIFFLVYFMQNVLLEVHAFPSFPLVLCCLGHPLFPVKAQTQSNCAWSNDRRKTTYTN